MDIKEIAQKVIAGGKYEELAKDLDTGKKAELDLAISVAAKAEREKELSALDGIRAEKNRQQDLANKAGDEAVSKVKSQIRGEQVTKARKAFMEEMGLAEDKMAEVDTAFKTEDTGDVFDADLIKPLFRKAYAKAFADTLIQDQKDKQTFQRNAIDFNFGGAAGGNAGGGGGADDKKYAPEVHEMVREAAKRGIPLTLDQAERGMRSGPRVFTQKK